MRMAIEWISVDERFPHDGVPVAAAVTGRYPVDPDDPEPLSGQEFWLVLPAHFRRLHLVEDTGEVVENCFIDADRVVRHPLGGRSDELVTHWAALPNLPGTDVPRVIGDGVQPALRAASGD
ncbi:AQJ64_40280 family protein [Saccharothrix yanglingensis]|uniref:Amine oxidase n=1 Tax=Saccharothrix yanglingensis TaxID=659496 RepID=A0ABU0X8F9_9PSEU|nr:AQJ64_40280 family protein [Saccharothrix yanglingensis]MDQ2588421.1 amine oxidase [Saccharothrix yanglingensis]